MESSFRRAFHENQKQKKETHTHTQFCVHTNSLHLYADTQSGYLHYQTWYCNKLDCTHISAGEFITKANLKYDQRRTQRTHTDTNTNTCALFPKIHKLTVDWHSTRDLRFDSVLQNCKNVFCIG